MPCWEILSQIRLIHFSLLPFFFLTVIFAVIPKDCVSEFLQFQEYR